MLTAWTSSCVRQRAEHGTKKQSPNARKKLRNKPQRNIHSQKKNTYIYIHITPRNDTAHEEGGRVPRVLERKSKYHLYGSTQKKKTSSAPKSIAPFPPPSYIARVCLDISCLDKYSAIINSHHTSSILGVLGHRRKGKAAYATSRKFTTPALANTLKETPP